MNDHNFHRREFYRKSAGQRSQLLIGVIGIGMVLAWIPAHASESQTPWECSNYTGDAHTRCVETFAQTQRDQIAELQGKVQAQQESINSLKAQLDRQTSTNADLQRQLARPPSVVRAVPPFYAYPPVGLSFSLGNPWIYGSPFLYGPYLYGPGYYGSLHWSHRW